LAVTLHLTDATPSRGSRICRIGGTSDAQHMLAMAKEDLPVVFPWGEVGGRILGLRGPKRKGSC
jgi:hypothetical protein